jgi:hypothetical protein
MFPTTQRTIPNHYLTIAPKPTYDAGRWFRSVLEARWNRLFLYLDMAAQYEPRVVHFSLKIEGKSGYVPDFFLSDNQIYLEIKPKWVDDPRFPEIPKYLERPLLVLWGNFPDHPQKVPGWTLYTPDGRVVKKVRVGQNAEGLITFSPDAWPGTNPAGVARAFERAAKYKFRPPPAGAPPCPF